MKSRNTRRVLFLVLLIIFSFLEDNRLLWGGNRPVPGIENMDLIVGMLRDSRVALVVNQTSVLGNNPVHLLDTLLNRGIKVVKIFSPEHGFRGLADAGASVSNSRDIKTNIPVISLFGKQLKPTQKQLRDVDVVVYDIQDVGLRFYTYISTLHYVMEACADCGKRLIILDRPNPNDYVDGPMMEDGYQSFIGLDYLPMFYGMTPGELALMINKEGWLKSKSDSCLLEVVPLKNWRHGDPYSLPVKASPNLPNDQSVRLYASICIMGPTGCSVGRGTEYPFQVIGFLNKCYGDFCFTPKSMSGFALHPVYEGKKCYGMDLRKYPYEGGLTLQFLLGFYKKSGKAFNFIKDTIWFDHLAGSDKLRRQIQEGFSEKEIRTGWKNELEQFRRMRSKYLLYPDYK